MNDYYDVRLKKNRLEELNQYPPLTFVTGNISNKQNKEELFTQYNPLIVVYLATWAGASCSLLSMKPLVFQFKNKRLK